VHDWAPPGPIAVGTYCRLDFQARVLDCGSICLDQRLRELIMTTLASQRRRQPSLFRLNNQNEEAARLLQTPHEAFRIEPISLGTKRPGIVVRE
jgi:hypothetical protein